MISNPRYRPATSVVAPVERYSSGKKFGLVDNGDPNRLLKLGIWSYFFLLIFEGALRKWFLPGLAGPLLIVRDPLALWMVVFCWKQGLLPKTPYLSGMVLIGMIGFFTAIFFGHGNFAVAIYGIRILVIHFPFMFVIGKIFDRNDVVKLGKITLWIAIFMAVLIAMQFFSPQSAWVNRGVGGDMEGSGFSGAMGFFRPSATFSFTNGTTLFFGFAACFVFYFWLTPFFSNKFILLGATTALIFSIPFSISRGLLFQVGVCGIFAMIAISRKPEYIGRMIVAGLLIMVVFVVLGRASIFQTATGAFSERFKVANKVEGGMEGVFLDRYLGGMIKAVTDSNDLPVFGHGLGMGTNVGSFILSGRQQFLISEEEWGRLIGELGLLLGLAVILIRLGVCIEIGSSSYKMLARGDLLPWLLFSFGLLTILQAQWAQPTALGFSTVIGGLMIASLKEPRPNCITKKMSKE